MTAQGRATDSTPRTTPRPAAVTPRWDVAATPEQQQAWLKREAERRARVEACLPARRAGRAIAEVMAGQR